ncbi:MAG: NifU family protein [Candidatus Methanoperedens sp.]|nr:NifU family protein [Candidatus Methanoperedens sp.]MCZ7358962.1 NifU family protein [Candidatus Methanoperedens sp.]HLB70786.1 NifU family protein [Candidatus Methanoperedens sp.]
MKEKIEKTKVEKVIDEHIRPMLKADGGDIKLIEVKEDIIKVQLTGACGSCPMSQLTLRQGVERVLKEYIPEIKSVVGV